MKKTQFIELLRIINKTKVSFVSITMFIALGITIFLGFGWSGNAVVKSVFDEMKEKNMYDTRVVYPLGFDEADLDRIRNLDTVTDVEGTYFANKFFMNDGNKCLAKIVSLTDRICVSSQIEGQLPQTTNEIAVEKEWAKKNGVKISDEITFLEDNKSLLKSNSFTVTALLENVAYLGTAPAAYGIDVTSGVPINCIMYTAKESFNESAFGGYVDIYIKSSQFDNLTLFNDEFEKNAESFEAELKELTDSLAKEKTDKLKVYGEVPDYKCNITSANENTSICSIDILAKLFNKLRYNMAALFVVFGLLVCYSCVSRIIYDHVKLIGTKKAMGFNSAEITLIYVTYTFLTVVIGAIIGVCLARFVIEPVLLNSLKKSYTFESMSYYFDVKDSLFIIITELVLIIGTGYIACRGILRRNAVLLLNGVKNTVGKIRFYEKYRLWEKLSLFTKTIVNNCFNDKRRMFSTVVGIAGCTSLVVCSLTLRNSVLNSYDKHYKDVFGFNNIVYFDSKDDKSKQKIENILADNKIDYCELCQTMGIIEQKDGTNGITYLMVDMNEDFKSYVKTNPVDGIEKTTENGAWISSAYYNEFGINKGENIKYTDSINGEQMVEIQGVCEYYLPRNQLIINSSYYEELYGEKPLSNCLLINVSDDEIKSLTNKLMDIPGFMSIDRYYDNSYTAFKTFESIANIVVIVYIL